MLDPSAAADALRGQARTLGFDAVGCARLDPAETDDRLSAWIESGKNADMRWFERTGEVRRNPAHRLPDAKTVVVVAQGYWDGSASITARGAVARYARLTDYHNVLGDRVRDLAAWLDSLQPGARSFFSVDSGAIMEKRWAERAGIGWQGRNTLIIREGMGSWMFLGAVVTSVEICPDSPVPNRCGDCDACVRACPTGALALPGVLDARKCLSYHTIENRGSIPAEIARMNPGCVAGCDICQEACPWCQPDRLTPAESPFTTLPTALLTAEMVLSADDVGLMRMLEGSPLQRLGTGRLRRNAESVRKFVNPS